MSHVDFACNEKLTGENPQLVIPKAVTVVGTGAFGSWVSVLAARAGVSRLRLINPSSSSGSTDVEGRELACGAFTERDFGMSKVVALKRQIHEINPKIDVETHDRRYDPDRDVELLEGTVFVGVANPAVYRALWKQCQKLGLRSFGGTYQGVNVGVLTFCPPNMKFESDSPVWVVSAALSASLAMHAACVEAFSFYGSPAELGQSNETVRHLFEEFKNDL